MSNQANPLPFETISKIAHSAGLNEDFTYTYSQVLGGYLTPGTIQANYWRMRD